MSAHPKRQRHHDRITMGGHATQAEIACDHAIAPFDRAMRESDRTWGVDRLVELVSPETAARFGKVRGMLNDEINGGDAARVAHVVAGCIRGLAAMDAEARKAGHQPTPAWLIETQVDDHHFAILMDGAEWMKAQAERPGLKLYTLREVSVALRHLETAAIAAVKDAFPSAEVVAIRPKRTPMPDDPIPPL